MIGLHFPLLRRGTRHWIKRTNSSRLVVRAEQVVSPLLLVKLSNSRGGACETSEMDRECEGIMTRSTTIRKGRGQRLYGASCSQFQCRTGLSRVGLDVGENILSDATAEPS